MDEQDNLWAAILKDVQLRNNTKLPSNKALVVLGDNFTGKTSIVAKLQGIEDPKKGWGLEYAYITVRDEYKDDLARLSVWVLDGHPGHLPLLKFGLSAETYPDTLVMLVASMTSPCTLLDQLNSWSKRLREHLRTLNINPDVEKECQHRCIKRWQEYSESGDDGFKRCSRSMEEDDLQPLDNNVLSRNYGLDIVVVITKTDYMSVLEKEYDYREEHFDFIQYHLRKFCMEHGAALFYTSAKEDKNCDLLYKHLTHRIYGIGPAPPALVVEKDAVLVPAGWDQANKIAILTESMHTIKPDQPYGDVITQPRGLYQRATDNEAEVVSEEDQAFLQRLLNLLQAGNVDPSPSPLRSGASPGYTSNLASTPTSMGLASSSLASAKKLDGKQPLANEGLLTNFFNSLLQKKSPAVPGKDVENPEEAAAELLRIAARGSSRPQDDQNESHA